MGDREKKLRVGGRVDRLDEVFSDSDKAQLRVVDYKTGGRVAAPLKSIDEVFDPKNVAFKKSDYTMQAMFYSLIEAEHDDKLNPLHHAVSPALLFIQHAGGDDYSPILSMEGKEITDITEYKEPSLNISFNNWRISLIAILLLVLLMILMLVPIVPINKCVVDNGLIISIIQFLLF